MLLNLLLASITILLCFYFLFRAVSNNSFIISLNKENAKLKLSLAIPIGAPVTLANDPIEMLLFSADKTIEINKSK